VSESQSAPATRDVGVVIVAGGSSTRAGGANGARELKQFRWVAGKPTLLHSLQTFMARPDVVSVVCVLPREYAADPPPWIFQCDIDRLMISTGGRTRTESVHNGLEDLPDEAAIVLVHDAARPLVGDATIDRVVQTVRGGACAIAALPVVDTLKEVDETGMIVRTIERERLWRAQTPQGFPRETIVRAHREARQQRLSATDDAALCERLGIPVQVVRGSERAMKITDETDFARAEAMFMLPE
jgi:2-C-methyl-D-erythritol 4-phosphate cytidylyltransferase